MIPFGLVFALVQWGVILPVQCWMLWRSVRNWKQSERDRMEAADNLFRSREQLRWFRTWAALQGCDLPDADDEPTLQ